jgi:hypothetical protein
MNDHVEVSTVNPTVRQISDVFVPMPEPWGHSFGTCSVWGHRIGPVDARLPSEWFEPNLQPQVVDSSVIFVLGPALLIDGSAMIARGMESVAARKLFVSSEALVAKREHSTIGMLVGDVQRWTGWSDRKTARLLGTTHPTVRRLANNEFSARSSPAIEQLRNLHDLLSRLRPLVSTPIDLASVLTRAKSGRLTAERLITSGEFGEAYRAALRALTGPHPTMLGGSGVPVAAATHSVDHDDRV